MQRELDSCGWTQKDLAKITNRLPQAINEMEFSSFVSQTKPKFSKKAITEFTRTQNRHPGIILGRLHHEELVPYRNLRNLLVKVKLFLSD